MTIEKLNDFDKNLTEKRFSNIMADAMQKRFFEKGIYNDIDNKDVKKLWNRFYVEFKCVHDIINSIRSKYLMPSYVLNIYKKYTNKNGDSALELWKTYWFNIGHVNFRLSEDYNKNMAENPAWLMRLEQREIYQYNTTNKLENVMIKIRNELFNN